MKNKRILTIVMLAAALAIISLLLCGCPSDEEPHIAGFFEQDGYLFQVVDGK